MLATLGHVGQDSGWYSHSLRAGWSGHRIPVGERFGAPIWSSRPYSYGYWGLPGFKVAWGSVNHPPPCNAEVEFCTYNLPVVPAWTVLEWTLPLPVTLQCCIQRCIKYCDVCPDSTGRLNFCYLLLKTYALFFQESVPFPWRPAPYTRSQKNQEKTEDQEAKGESYLPTYCT